jgi:hypothetical protein
VHCINAHARTHTHTRVAGGLEALHIQVVFDLNVCLDVLTGHTRPPALAARAKAVEERLLCVVDPIDYTFLAPLLHTSRANECQASPASPLHPHD